MEFVFDNNKDTVLQKLRDDINRNNRYIGGDFKIAGKIKEDKIFLNLEDRYGKGSKFFNQVFTGTISENEDKSVIKGKFRIDIYPLILYIILLLVAVESFAVNVVLYGFTFDIILPVLVIAVVAGCFVTMKKRSAVTNKYIEEYLKSFIL